MALKQRRKPRSNSQPIKAKVAIEHTQFYGYVQQYDMAMSVKHVSKHTRRNRDSDLRRFVAWCEERGLQHPRDISKPILEAYQRHLYFKGSDSNNGKRLSVVSQRHYMSSVQEFFKWLTKQNYLLSNPASEIELPKIVRGLPTVLTEEEIAQLLAQPDIGTLGGLRDRAILEVFYSTGIRRSELCDLQLADINLSAQTLFVNQGKGGKDRLVPLGANAAHWTQRYLNEIRPLLGLDDADHTLFLNDYGDGFRDTKLGDKVKRYMVNAGIEQLGSCHLLRHAMATHMLEGGADIRYVQAMLGHSDLTSTQIYTHVSIRTLKEVHARTHPNNKNHLGGQLARVNDETLAADQSPDKDRAIEP